MTEQLEEIQLAVSTDKVSGAGELLCHSFAMLLVIRLLSSKMYTMSFSGDHS